MKKIVTTVLTLASAGALFLHVPRVAAQDDAPPPPPPGAEAKADGGPNGDRAGRMQEFRQRMAERIKTQLKASDDEWAVIQPLLEKVETKQRESMMSRFAGLGGPGGWRGGPRRADGSNGGGEGERARPEGRENGERGPRRGVSPEVQALNETLQDDKSTPEQIKVKLAAVREERKKNAADLASAREDLKKVLNMRQEATMVAMGILD